MSKKKKETILNGANTRVAGVRELSDEMCESVTGGAVAYTVDGMSSKGDMTYITVDCSDTPLHLTISQEWLATTEDVLAQLSSTTTSGGICDALTNAGVTGGAYTPDSCHSLD